MHRQAYVELHFVVFEATPLLFGIPIQSQRCAKSSSWPGLPLAWSLEPGAWSYLPSWCCGEASSFRSQARTASIREKTKLAGRQKRSTTRPRFSSSQDSARSRSPSPGLGPGPGEADRRPGARPGALTAMVRRAAWIEAEWAPCCHALPSAGPVQNSVGSAPLQRKPRHLTVSRVTRLFSDRVRAGKKNTAGEKRTPIS